MKVTLGAKSIFYRLHRVAFSCASCTLHVGALSGRLSIQSFLHGEGLVFLLRLALAATNPLLGRTTQRVASLGLGSIRFRGIKVARPIAAWSHEGVFQWSTVDEERRCQSSAKVRKDETEIILSLLVVNGPLTSCWGSARYTISLQRKVLRMKAPKKPLVELTMQIVPSASDSRSVA